MAHESQQRVWRLTRQLEARQQPLYFPYIKRREHGLVGSNDIQAFSSLWKTKVRGQAHKGVSCEPTRRCILQCFQYESKIGLFWVSFPAFIHIHVLKNKKGYLNLLQEGQGGFEREHWGRVLNPLGASIKIVDIREEHEQIKSKVLKLKFEVWNLKCHWGTVLSSFIALSIFSYWVFSLEKLLQEKPALNPNTFFGSS